MSVHVFPYDRKIRIGYKSKRGCPAPKPGINSTQGLLFNSSRIDFEWVCFKNDIDNDDFGKSTNQSLVGGLRDRLVDYSETSFELTWDRFQTLSFNIPIERHTPCILFSKEHNRHAPPPTYRHYYLTPFSMKVWAFLITTVAVFLMVKMISKRNNTASHVLNRIELGATMMANLFLCGLYCGCLDANFLHHNVQTMPFDTLEGLEELISTKQFTLITDSTKDYRFDRLNNSNITSVIKLRETIYEEGNIELVPRQKWKMLIGKRKMMIDSNTVCKDKCLAQIEMVCPKEFAGRLLAYPLPKNTSLEEWFNRGFDFTMSVYVKKQRKHTTYYRMDKRVHHEHYPFTLNVFTYIIAEYSIALVFCVIILVCEMTFDKLRNMYEK